MITRKLITFAAVSGLTLSLAACGDSSEETTTTATTSATSAEETTTEQATTSSEETSASSSTESQATTPATEEDPVFAAIDAVMAEYADGIITSIDREDDSDMYEIDVVVGQEIQELDVNAATGEVRVTESDDSDADDIREATEATVTAADAVTQALDEHPDGVLDEVSLDEDNGNLQWEISLDDDQRRDLVELTIPAV